MDEVWPDQSVPYEYPPETDGNAARWQAGLDGGLADANLRLALKGRRLYELVGACPRCGHGMSQEIEFDPVLGVDEVDERIGQYNVDCNCGSAHAGRDAEHKGCGWGGPLVVEIREP